VSETWTGLTIEKNGARGAVSGIKRLCGASGKSFGCDMYQNSAVFGRKDARNNRKEDSGVKERRSNQPPTGLPRQEGGQLAAPGWIEGGAKQCSRRKQAKTRAPEETSQPWVGGRGGQSADSQEKKKNKRKKKSSEKPCKVGERRGPRRARRYITKNQVAKKRGTRGRGMPANPGLDEVTG